MSTITSVPNWQADTLPKQNFCIRCDLGEFLVQVRPGLVRIGDTYTFNPEDAALWLRLYQAQPCDCID